MKENFKIIIIVVFIAGAVLSVFVFSGAIPIGKKTDTTVAKGTVVLWGTVKASAMSPLLEEFNNVNTSFSVKYVEKNSAIFNQALLEAIASGGGPDMFLLPDDLIFDYYNKIYLIPYAGYPLVTFKNTFAGAGEVFLTSSGILAFPVTIDPIMMYYNRSTLDNNNITTPPSYWDDFITLAPKLTQKDENKKIIKSAIALGQFSNINNAKAILSTLFLQTGSKMVVESGGRFYSDFGPTAIAKPDSALAFYSSFADPSKDYYSWNRLLPNSLEFFTAGDLAFYLGFSSELPQIINKNPNLNFAVTSIPQIKNANNKSTYARVSGIAISKFSKNINTALVASSLLASGTFANNLANSLAVAPATRGGLAIKPTDQYFPYFYTSALYAKSWIDPSALSTNDIFKKMVDEVLSNNSGPAEAIAEASSQIDFLLNK
ncbi:MAG: extracellular solute-binding protein [bacterium]|nr:extracellular solute-binding protein [bacterium]